MKTLFAILSTDKYKDTRQKALKRSWLISQDYFFASDKTDEDQVKLSDKTDHSSAEEKQLNSLTYIVNHGLLNYDHFFFCDDDTSVNISLWNKLSHTFLGKNIGWIISPESDPRNPIWQRVRNFKYFSGGAGFVLTRNAVLAMAEFVPHYKERTKYGDISIGNIIQRLGIPIEHCELFHMDVPSVYGHNNTDIKTNLTYHYVKEPQMKELYEIQDLP